MDKKNYVFIGIKKAAGEGKISFSILGSGLIVEGKKIITCAHVYNEIPDDFKASVFAGILREGSSFKFENYDSYDITLIKKDDDRDIGVFQIKDPENKIVNYGVPKSIFEPESVIEKIEVQSPLYFFGFPLANEFLKMNMGATLTVSGCIVGSKKFRGSDGKIDFLLVDKAINPGSSGSPVFYGQKIIGLASATINKTHKIGENSINIPVGIGIIRTSNYILDILSGI